MPLRANRTRTPMKRSSVSPSAHVAASTQSVAPADQPISSAGKHSSRAQRSKNSRPSKRRNRKAGVGKIIKRCILGLIAVCIGAVVGIYFSSSAPDPAAMPMPEPTSVYYADGTTKIGDLTDPQREVVKLDAVAEVMRTAVVDSVDPDFYDRPAASLGDLVNQTWESLWGSADSDQDSLTTVYAAQLGQRGRQVPLISALKEKFMPIRIERTLSKDEILERFLNTAYYGRGAYGVQAAAQAYFHVPASDLTLSQAALLAAVMPAPSSWDPAIDRAQAEKQYARVLKAMVENGSITQEDADAAAFPEVQQAQPGSDYSGTQGYLLDYVRKELNSQARIAHEVIDQAGLKVITTFDKSTQEAAIKAVNDAGSGRPEQYQTGVFSMDPSTGNVLAIYGGADYSARATNNATGQRIPAGSPFKVFALIENFDQGFSSSDEYYHYNNGWINNPNNQSASYPSIPAVPAKQMTLQTATAANLNDTFVYVGGEVGVESVMERAKAMGIPSDAPGWSTNDDAVLGRVQVTPQEMARAYAAVNNAGTLLTPHAIDHVENAQGATIYQASSSIQSQRVMNEDIAASVTDIMRSPLSKDGVAYGNGGALAEKLPVAGLPSNGTDTSASWFVGYTPSVVTAVALFSPQADGSLQELAPFGGDEDAGGRGYALRVFSAYTQAVSDGKDVGEFPHVSK